MLLFSFFSFFFLILNFKSGRGPGPGPPAAGARARQAAGGSPGKDSQAYQTQRFWFEKSTRLNDPHPTHTALHRGYAADKQGTTTAAPPTHQNFNEIHADRGSSPAAGRYCTGIRLI